MYYNLNEIKLKNKISTNRKTDDMLGILKNSDMGQENIVEV